MDYLVQTHAGINKDWITVDKKQTATRTDAMREFRLAARILIDMDYGMANTGCAELLENGKAIVKVEVTWLV